MCFAIKIFQHRKIHKEKLKKSDANRTKKSKISYHLAKIIVKSFFYALRWLITHLKVDILNVCVRVGGPDASSAAINYGKICASVGSTINLLSNNKNIKNYTIKVFPDFNFSKIVLNIELKFGTSFFNLVKCFTKSLFNFIKLYLKRQKVAQ